MSRVPLGMLIGLVIGGVDVLLMLPLSCPDRLERRDISDRRRVKRALRDTFGIVRKSLILNEQISERLKERA